MQEGTNPTTGDTSAPITRLDTDTLISLMQEALDIPPAPWHDKHVRDRIISVRAHALLEALRPLTTASLAAQPTQEDAAYWINDRITGLRRTLAVPELAYEPAPEPTPERGVW